VSHIAIVDHGAGNLVSIEQGLRLAGADARVAASPDELDFADAVVLPGVGATGAAMARLEATGMADALQQWQGPLLGICVGLQLLFTESDEDGGRTLDLLAGRVERLEAERLPHMGWNDVALEPDPIFRNIPDGTPFYFVHSYAPAPVDAGIVIATTEYGGETITAAVRSGAYVGVQFHPERSSRRGLQVLANFVGSVREADRAA
jgi:glutamine amidotransferase